MTNEPIQPGIHYSMTWADYFAIPAMNKSTLCVGLKSMAHLRAYQDKPDREPTAAMRFGQFIHSSKLEPMSLLERYAVLPDLTDGITKADGSPTDNPIRTAKYRLRLQNWQSQNDDKITVTADEYARMLGMMTALGDHPGARQYLEQPGQTETVIVWDDPLTGIRCKGRVDKLGGPSRRPHEAPDLKTCNDISRFNQTIARYSYDIQVAFYQDGLEVLTGEPWSVPLVVVEPEPPYGVSAACLHPDSINAGRRKYRRLLERYALCVRDNVWPGYESPPFWELPEWAMNDGPIELVIGTQRVAI